MRTGTVTARLAVFCLAVPFAQQPGPAQLPSTAGTGAISGVVTDAATKRPLAGATVSLGMDRPAGTLRPPPLQQTLTDEKGRFVFWPVPAGAGYFVNVSALGYMDGGYGREGSATGRRITLADRQWVDAADVALWRPGAIGGRLLDEHGDPVVGAYVRVMRVVHVAGRVHLASGPNATTDDRGSYRFAGLAPGRYYVVAPSTQMAAPESVLAPLVPKLPPSRPAMWTTGDPMIDVDGVNRLVVGRYPVPPSSPDGRLMAYPVTWHPGTATVTAATPIDLDIGADRTNVDIRLQPVPTARVSGVVQGPPAGGAPTMLRLVPAGSEGLGLGSEAATTLAAGDGTFTFVNVPAGDYTIDVRGTLAEYEYNSGAARYNLPIPPGLTNTASSAMSLSSGTPGTGFATMTFGSDQYWARLPVTVGDRDVTNLIVVLHPAARLEGRIVLDGQAQPPMPRFISADPADGNAALGQPRSTSRSGESPVFLLQGLMPGEYFLRIAATGDWIVKSIVADGRDYTDAPFDAASGRDFTDIVVTMTDKPGSIEGTVTTADGRPTAATVIAFPADRSRWTNYGLAPARIKTTRVSNVGSYRLGALPAGDYLVIAVDDSHAAEWHDPAFFPAAAGGASRVSVEWGARALASLRLVEVRLR